ncbi:MAG: hypothetical protein EA383_09440 [Spirochaetaceae bacterium]|nr:MAG: hypothetical protein EA383_09440 [Spirochaetaceae bacterium]
MNEEFHYYTIAMIARKAGFSDDDADIIAYASQFVDHALVAYRVSGRGVSYTTLTTHHFGFWDKSQEESVWIPFHFFPGDGTDVAQRRKDRVENPLAVTGNSDRVKELLVTALKTRDLMRIGIALHTFADAYAHQNFTGRNEEFNRIDVNSPVPPAGHAHAGRGPDRFEGRWTDARLREPWSQVINRDRYLAAAGKIYRYLATYKRQSFADEELVLTELELLLGPGGAEHSAEARILDFIINYNIPRYSRNTWKGEAIELNRHTGDEEITSVQDKYLWLRHELGKKTGFGQVREVRAKPGFFQSSYHHWHEAAREHRVAASRILSDLKLAGLKALAS